MNQSVRQLLVLLVDLLLATVAIVSAEVVVTTAPLSSGLVLAALKPGVVLVICWFSAIYVQGLYSKAPTRSRLVLGWLVLRCVFISSAIAMVLTYSLVPAWLAERLFYLVSIAIMTIGTVITRLWLMAHSTEFYRTPRVLLIGNNGLKHVEFLIENLNDSLSNCLTGYIETEPDGGANPTQAAIPGLGNLDEIPRAIEQQQISHVALCEPLTNDTHLEKVLTASAVNGVKLITFEALFMELTEQAPILEMDGHCDLSLIHNRRSIYGERLQQLVSTIVCLLVLPIALPLIGLAAIAIKLTSPGPVFYKQERVGKDGHPFAMMKLRTMKQNAEKETGAVWASRNDPRVTPVGRVLRQTRLDELPQLFNVLRGDMSLIGPRPERLRFVEEFKQIMPMYDLRHSVRPGITGWAQVNQGYDTCAQDVFRKLRYDLYHICNMSLSLDLRIILRTILIMLQKWRAH